MTPLEQRVRVLLARRQARENRRPAAAHLLAADARAEGLAPSDLHAGLRGLARHGLAMRVEAGWTLRPPPPPSDVTRERARRMRLADP